MSDYPMLISNKLHSFRNFMEQRYEKIGGKRGDGLYITSFCMKYITIYPGQTPDLSRLNFKFIEDKL